METKLCLPINLFNLLTADHFFVVGHSPIFKYIFCYVKRIIEWEQRCTNKLMLIVIYSRANGRTFGFLLVICDFCAVSSSSFSSCFFFLSSNNNNKIYKWFNFLVEKRLVFSSFYPSNTPVQSSVFLNMDKYLTWFERDVVTWLVTFLLFLSMHALVC